AVLRIVERESHAGRGQRGAERRAGRRGRVIAIAGTDRLGVTAVRVAGDERARARRAQRIFGTRRNQARANLGFKQHQLFSMISSLISCSSPKMAASSS